MDYKLTEEAFQYLLNIHRGINLLEVRGESVSNLYKCQKSLEKVFEGISKEEISEEEKEKIE